MHALQDIEQLLSTLTRAEKVRGLQWVFRDLGEAFPGIESTPDVCGGNVSSAPYALSEAISSAGIALGHESSLDVVPIFLKQRIEQNTPYPCNPRSLRAVVDPSRSLESGAATTVSGR